MLEMRKDFQHPGYHGPHRPGVLSLYYTVPPQMSTFLLDMGVYNPSRVNPLGEPSTESSRVVNRSASA